MAEASSTVGLDSVISHTLGTALGQGLDEIRESAPPWLTTEAAVIAVSDRLNAAILKVVDQQVADVDTRYRLRLALCQGCHDEALRRGGSRTVDAFRALSPSGDSDAKCKGEG
jgi:hypothetical protein